MDAAWALYEAWVKIQTGEVDTALVYGFGKSSAGVLRRILALQLDPYMLTPLWPDTVSLAGLQARAGIDAGLWDERAMAEVANRSLDRRREERVRHPQGRLVGRRAAGRPMYADPLRKHDCAPVTDGAAAIVLAAGDRAYDAVERPAWITGFEHHVDALQLGGRDLTRSPSAAAPATRPGVDGRRGGRAARAVHAPGADPAPRARRSDDDVRINPSGGALAGNPMFTGGLNRIGEAARRVWDGRPTECSATRPAARRSSRTSCA